MKVKKMIDVEYAKNFQNLTDKYLETGFFEDIENEAQKFNKDAYNKTIENTTEYDNRWKYFKEECTRPFRFYDIVEIAKILRKLLREEFGKDIKFQIKTERGYTDTLWIKIKPQNEKYLQPLDEYMAEYKETYFHRHGVEHPYISDEVFEKNAKLHIDRLNDDVQETIRNIVELFKMDNSDIMTDYFDINYITWFKMEIDGESNPGYTGI